MASKIDPEEADIPSDEQVGVELKKENESEKEATEVVTKGESEKKSKKKRGKKKQQQESGQLVTAGEASAVRSMRELLTQLGVAEQTDGDKSHVFWDTQPVPKLEDKVAEYGPIEVDKDSIREHPLTLPEQFEWDIVEIMDDEQLLELYTLLNGNYVEDDDNLFRFDYSMNFLRWALTPPGWKSQWHCGVRVSSNHKLVGFISAIPAHMRIRQHEQLMVEINFLCVHKKLRSKRMAPVLIREITRRVNLEGIFQATYTAGVLLPKPMAACRYWHRSLNPKKLVDIQFSQIPRNLTMQRMIRLYRLPEEVKTPGVRPMEEKDLEEARLLLNRYLEKFLFSPIYKTKDEFRHWFLPRPGVIDCFVVEDPDTNRITDMFSFYHLPSTVVRHKTHKQLNSTYSFYNISTKTPLKSLMYDALITAKQLGCDVFNALDLMDNKTVLEELKFGMGDGNLHYYLYNYKCPELQPEQVALVLL